MKEKLTNIILKYCDNDLMIVNLSGMVDEIEELYASERWTKINAELATDWAAIDPVKWGDLRKQGDIDMEEI